MRLAGRDGYAGQMLQLAELIGRFAQPGRVAWIGVRPERRAEMRVLEAVEVGEAGLAGDHRATPGKRAVTLIQAEHLPVIAALSGVLPVSPAQLRRNLMVSGVNLLGLRGRVVAIGSDVRLWITGPCAPCSRMETALGHGGYAAMRGHGGMTAEVLAEGPCAVGDPVLPQVEG